MNASFERLAPYLKDPLVLIGFFLLIAFSFCRYLVKQRIIPPLPKALGYQILRLILLYGFIIGLVLIILGFALKRQELINQHRAAENIELMLRDALKQAPWLSEEKKNEIVQQIIEAYRSGALSKEQVEKKVEEIKVTFTRTNNPPAPGLSNQFHSVNKADAKTNRPPLTSQPEIDNSSFKQSVEPMAGAETQSPVSQSEKTRVQNESLTNANVIILPHIDISKNIELRRGAGKGDILIGSNLVKGFDMFVESSQTKRDWLTQEPNSMKMAFPADQDWSVVLITVGRPTSPPRPSMDFSAFKALTIEMRGDSGGESIEIGIKSNTQPDSGEETKVPIKLKREWDVYNFSLIEFKGADPKTLYVVTEFVYSGKTPQIVYFRNIKYVR